MEATNHFSYIDLRQRPQLKDIAAEWFSGKWHIPVTAYLACMDDYLTGKTEYGWFLCLDGDRIVGGLGVPMYGSGRWGIRDVENVCT